MKAEKTNIYKLHHLKSIKSKNGRLCKGKGKSERQHLNKARDMTLLVARNKDKSVRRPIEADWSTL